jgi:hypothetical protein
MMTRFHCSRCDQTYFGQQRARNGDCEFCTGTGTVKAIDAALEKQPTTVAGAAHNDACRSMSVAKRASGHDSSRQPLVCETERPHIAIRSVPLLRNPIVMLTMAAALFTLGTFLSPDTRMRETGFWHVRAGGSGLLQGLGMALFLRCLGRGVVALVTWRQIGSGLRVLGYGILVCVIRYGVQYGYGYRGFGADMRHAMYYANHLEDPWSFTWLREPFSHRHATLTFVFDATNLSLVIGTIWLAVRAAQRERLRVRHLEASL